MSKSLLSLKLKTLTFNQLLNLANAVKKGMTAASGIYTNPTPTVAQLTTILGTYSSNLFLWQDKTQRSHQHYLNLVDSRKSLSTALTRMSNYCEMVTPYDAVSLSQTGFPLRKEKLPVGPLQAVSNLRQIRSKKVLMATLKIQWNVPANAVSSSDISGYFVYRSADGTYANAEQVGWTTKNYFVDANPGIGYKTYWVIAAGSAGLGQLSDSLQAIATPLPA